jgi:hypothetical protein
MTENVEWMILGSMISQFAEVGAKPWELRLLALKGGRASTKDFARMAVRHGCDMRGFRLVPKEGK